MKNNLTKIEEFDFDSEFERTNNSKLDFIWKGDTLYRIGFLKYHMKKFFNTQDLDLKNSFKKQLLIFVSKRDYSGITYTGVITAIFKALKDYPSNKADAAWVSKALTIETFLTNINIIKQFFIQWKTQNPNAITDEGLQLLAKTKSKFKKSSNVTSDDPELSWLSDIEYEILVTKTWRNYEDNTFDIQTTLIILLAMQYARRPMQIAQLKFSDIKTINNETSISFPGIKDINSETSFRDSKFEVHPLSEQISTLLKIQLESIRTLYKEELDINLTDSQIEQVPIFTKAHRLKKAASYLKIYFGLEWNKNLEHELFHISSTTVSKTISWNSSRKFSTPVSHRTGEPIVVTATRLRHTRARQLARKGIQPHILSHWLGHTSPDSLKSYYNDPAETARKLNKAMAPSLIPLAMAFTGNLIDDECQASKKDNVTSRLEFENNGDLKNVGHCGKHSFCATTSIPIPCYRCKYFEPLVTAPHQEVLDALEKRQAIENNALHIGGSRNLLIPIDLSADIQAVKNCIARCNYRKSELDNNNE